MDKTAQNRYYFRSKSVQEGKVIENLLVLRINRNMQLFLIGVLKNNTKKMKRTPQTINSETSFLYYKYIGCPV